MAPITRGMRARAAASADRIPLDALLKVLLLLPAKELCRLRAVCRSWRTVISDKVFIAAHAACHGDPLFLVKFWGDKMSGVYIVDLAGTVLKRFDDSVITGGGPLHQLLRARSELACLARSSQSELALYNRCRVLHPATRAVHVLPNNPAVEHQDRVQWHKLGAFFTLGRVSSTGEHKVIRLLSWPLYAHRGVDRQFFEVFTINSGGGTSTSNNNHARWRGLGNPSHFVERCSSTAVDGVVYYLTSRIYDGLRGDGIHADCLVSFDLGREEWRRDLRGPISSNAGAKEASLVKRHQLALAELKGSLVVADHRRHPFDMDLWLLVDFGSAIWVKEYHIETASIITSPTYEYHLKLLLVLDDGRLVVYAEPSGRLLICDPGTNTFESVAMRSLHSIAVYTGNLLSLQERVRGCRSIVMGR